MSLDVDRIPRWAPGPDARINWDHPLAQRLAFYSLSAHGLDVVSGHRATKTGTLVPAASPYGAAVEGTANGSRMTWPAALAHPASHDAFTIMAVASGANANFGTRWLAKWNPGNPAGNNPYLLRLSAGGVMTFYVLGDAGTPCDASGIYNFGQTYTVVGTKLGSSLAIWIDGIRKGTATNAGTATPAYSTEASIIADTNGSAAGGVGVHTCAAMWDRVLSGGEIAALYADPFAMFEED